MAHFPNRPANALGGSEFLANITQSDSASRDNILAQEIIRGNIPDFLRRLVPITIKDKGNTLIYRVMPDYLCIGNDHDYIRVPLGASAAQKIADAFDCTLPTAKMSDQIWNKAKAQLKPQPMSGTTSTISGKTYNPQQFLQKKMTDTDSFAEHNRLIQEQLNKHKPGDLVAGHKKDVILSNQLSNRPDRVAIHGLHNTDGKPIQGGYWKHNATYRDYSHGIRLVDKQAVLNGKTVNLIEDIMKEPELSYLISKEGPLQFTSYKHDNKRQNIPSEDTAIAQKFKNIDKFLEELSVAASKSTGRQLLLQRILNNIKHS